MRKKAMLLFFPMYILMITGCTITHKYGPFSGKVVDAETGEPIEGAAVLIGFHTKSSSVGGWVYSIADAIETLTDEHGEFHFSPKRITLIKAMTFWDKDCRISIFKPGYGAYPGHSKAVSSWKNSHSWHIPEEEYIVYSLPKLMTIKERKDNLSNINQPTGLTNDKMPNLRRLESEERVTVGLEPFNSEIWRKTQ